VTRSSHCDPLQGMEEARRNLEIEQDSDIIYLFMRCPLLIKTVKSMNTESQITNHFKENLKMKLVHLCALEQEWHLSSLNM
jgi:hypothetical protein